MRNFLRHFLTRVRQLKRHFLIFKITALLFGFSVQSNAIFSLSSAASGAVSSKLHAAVPKMAEKDALRYLKTFFVSFVLKYADKEKKTIGSLHVQWPFLFVWDRTKLWVTSIVVCDLQRHFRTDFRHFRVFSGIYAIDPKLEGTLVRPERMLPFQKLMPVLLKCIFTFLSPDKVRHYLLSIGRSAHFLFW